MKKIFIIYTIIGSAISSTLFSCPITFINDNQQVGVIITDNSGHAIYVEPGKSGTIDAAPTNMVSKVTSKVGLRSEILRLYFETKPGLFEKYCKLSERFHSDNDKKNSFTISEVKRAAIYGDVKPDRVTARFNIKNYKDKKVQPPKKQKSKKSRA